MEAKFYLFYVGKSVPVIRVEELKSATHMENMMMGYLIVGNEEYETPCTVVGRYDGKWYCTNSEEWIWELKI